MDSLGRMVRLQMRSDELPADSPMAVSAVLQYELACQVCISAPRLLMFPYMPEIASRCLLHTSECGKTAC